MESQVYEKVVTGKNLNRIFNDIGKLDIFENFTIHIETVDGTKNNYIYKTKDGDMEVKDLHVSQEALKSLKMM